eukprot:c4509_g1_i1.p1 GENE.c4509_g1_i1~~c4509_g1_i1.p1  ORF type:complete len:500 (+),score=122.61 c4509_g1_i1:54-1502(+)
MSFVSDMDNFLVLTDSYKLTHYPQYPPGTTEVYSYFESRGGVYPEVCFFGLQYILKRYFEGQVVTQERIDRAEKYFQNHIGYPFNRKGWEYILHKHDGRLPLSIKAVPEGTAVPNRNVLMTVTNTDPECYWLSNYAETLLVQVWYPMTVCTHSREQKKIILEYLKETGDPSPANANFKLHDFGFRGVSSVESAALGGAGHLVNFLGTDTMVALALANEYYSEPCAGYSIPASEHSTITSWGKDHELDAMRNMLTTYKSGLVACVSDSFDVFRACAEYWGTELRELIMSRDGTLVVRPDSGDPPTIVLKCLDILGEKFGTTVNEKGYKVLDSHVRLIQGDGIDAAMIRTILTLLKEHKWSADNVAFGSGGALLQKLNRDTQKCAFKCSHVTINGISSGVFKDPITDPGKMSKKGKLILVKDEATHSFRTLAAPNSTSNEANTNDPPFATPAQMQQDVLVEVFRNGKLLREWTFAEIRQRAALV